MFKWIIAYMQGVDNEPSSKRLLGLISGTTFCGLCLVGGLIQLRAHAFSDYENILVILGTYSGGLLGVSVLERRNKARYRASETDSAANLETSIDKTNVT